MLITYWAMIPEHSHAHDDTLPFGAGSIHARPPISTPRGGLPSDNILTQPPTTIARAVIDSGPQSNLH
jgi:hypothetical protein